MKWNLNCSHQRLDWVLSVTWLTPTALKKGGFCDSLRFVKHFITLIQKCFLRTTWMQRDGLLFVFPQLLLHCSVYVLVHSALRSLLPFPRSVLTLIIRWYDPVNVRVPRGLLSFSLTAFESDARGSQYYKCQPFPHDHKDAAGNVFEQVKVCGVMDCPQIPREEAGEYCMICFYCDNGILRAPPAGRFGK